MQVAGVVECLGTRRTEDDIRRIWMRARTHRSADGEVEVNLYRYIPDCEPECKVLFIDSLSAFSLNQLLRECLT